jgi:Zn-dependent alcohol dehydrogenase
MKAAVLVESGKPLEIADDVEIDDPGPGEVRVRVRYCGVCHSDLSGVDGSFPCETPMVLGHEAAGVIDAVGAGVTGLAPGDPVVLTPCPPCGNCYFCQRGQPTICVNSSSILTGRLPDGRSGLARRGQVVARGLGVGAFAEYVLTPQNGAIKIPADVPLDIACVIGCAVQTGVGAVLNTAGVEAGASVLVMGLGGIGLSIVMGARLAAAGHVICSDPLAERREVARGLGATETIDPGADDLASRVLELTGVGVDYAFDAAGSAALISQGLAVTRPGGSVVCVGAPKLGDALVIDQPSTLIITEKKLLGCTLGSCHSPRDIPRLIRLWQTGQLDLEEEINQAMDDLARGRCIRTVLEI